MKKSLYSVFDAVAQTFGNPISEVNDASAIRAYTTSFKDNPHKNDYSLFKIAEYTDHDGTVTPCDVPIKIMTGFDIKLEQTEISQTA